jgi:hypothetical protein
VSGATSKAKAGDQPTYRLKDDGSLWANAWKVMAVVALVGIVGAVVGALMDPTRFAFSYLFAFLVAMTIGLGGLFLVLVLFVTGAGWGVSVRRTAEFIAAALPVLAVLVIPVLANYETLYEWAQVDHHHDDSPEPGAHGSTERLLGASPAKAQDRAPVAAPGGQVHRAYEQMDFHEHTPMEEALHHHLVEFKSAAWYPVAFWLGRSAIYLGVWILLSMLYFRWSTRQDETGDPELTLKMQRLAPVALILFGLTSTFAGVDWIMSLEPTWYSTIYGVYLFAGSAMVIFALVILITLSLNDHGLLGRAVNTEHYHDMGKLMFGFVCFWAYIGFSQWMLIWYANLPEELTYYHRRWEGGWEVVSMLLILGHFALPFLALISRVPKRRLGLLKAGAAWLVFMHVVDMYWFVMPYAPGTGFSPHWLDVACLFAVLGVFFGVVFFLMRRYPLIPVGDPRLHRALQHVQTQ